MRNGRGEKSASASENRSPKGARASGLFEALRLLKRNQRHAETQGVTPWQYAVLISTLEAAGLSELDLKSLVDHGCVEHAVDCTRAGQQQRRFRKPAPRPFDRRTCFILTEAGSTLADRMLVDGEQSSGAAVDRPRWDAERRELWVRSTLVRRFFRDAPFQERILAAFEERAWPERIADPLSVDPGLPRKDRLHNTIKNLNTGLKRSGLQFGGDGTGAGVRWEFVPPNVVPASAAVPYQSRARKAKGNPRPARICENSNSTKELLNTLDQP